VKLEIVLKASKHHLNDRISASGVYAGFGVKESMSRDEMEGEMDILSDSQDFVRVVMADVNPVKSGDEDTSLQHSGGKSVANVNRKRHFSEDNSTNPKKVRCDLDKSREICVPDDQTKLVLAAIEDMKTSFEYKLQALEDRVKTELRAEVRKEIENVRSDIDNEVKKLGQRVQAVEREGTGREDNTRCKIVLMNVQETRDESVSNKVMSIMRDGLKLPRVSFQQVERRQSRNSRRPGIIIATCASTEEKNEIMKKKRLLRNSRNFKDVFVVPYNTPSEQREIQNLRTIVNTIGGNRLRLQGNRIVPEDNQRQQHHGRPNNEERLYSSVTRNEENNEGWQRVGERGERNGNRNNRTGKR